MFICYAKQNFFFFFSLVTALHFKK